MVELENEQPEDELKTLEGLMTILTPGSFAYEAAEKRIKLLKRGMSRY